jgi:hypothetical protein
MLNSLPAALTAAEVELPHGYNMSYCVLPRRTMRDPMPISVD